MLKWFREICAKNKFRTFFTAVVLIGLAVFYIYAPEHIFSPNIYPQQNIGKLEIIRIGGADSAYPLFKILTHEFMHKNLQKKCLFAQPKHTGEGISGALSNVYDLGLISRNPKLKEKHPEIIEIPFALDAIVFAVHPSSRVKNLQAKQIQDIYAGKTTNWKDVGGEDAKIVVMDRPDYSSAKVAFSKTLFPKNFKFSPAAIIHKTQREMTAALQGTDYSIGYTSLGDIFSKQLNLTVISINGIFPTLRNIQKRTYPYVRHFSMIVSLRPNKKVMQLFKFIFSSEGTKIIERNGYLAITMSLTIATVPEQNILKQENRYRPLVTYLDKKMGNKVKVSLRHFPSYEEVVTGFLTGNVNAAFFGSLTYAIVKNKVNVVPVARLEKNGVSQYRGILLTRADSGIKGWKDLKGKSFSMIKETTAADIFPRLFLKKHGVDNADKFLGEIKYANSHETSIKMILNKSVAAGAVKDLIFEKMARENPRIKNELAVIAKSPPVPDNTLIIRRDIKVACFQCHLDIMEEIMTQSETNIQPGMGVCDYLKLQLQYALLDLDKTPGGQEVLRSLGADRFLPTDENDYKNLYKMIRESGVDLQQYYPE